MKSSREKRPFWYFVLAAGIVVLAVGVLAPGGRARLYELAGGLVIVLFAIVRLLLLKGARRRRRKRNS